MKRLWIIFFCFQWQLIAAEGNITLKIFDNIFDVLLQNRPKEVYVADKELYDILRRSETVHIVNNPKEASLILVPTMEAFEKIVPLLRDRKEDKPILFALSYRVLKNVPEAVGALYWKKGRSQLLFLKNRLQRYGVTVPKAFERYVVDSL